MPYNIRGSAVRTRPGFRIQTAGSVTQATSDTAGDEPSKDLISSLKELYSSGEYSDLVISCRGEDYHVHRAIVCTQSSFLSAACRAGFKETQEGKITLPDDDPRLVRILVHYLYHFDYDGQSQYERSHLDGPETDGDGTDVNEPIRGIPLTHAKVYALAEKYLIRGLKAVALRKFKAAVDSSLLDINDFLQATWEVYTSTVEDDRGLRDIVVKTLSSRSRWLDRKEVRDMLKGLGALTYDLVIYMHQHGRF